MLGTLAEQFHQPFAPRPAFRAVEVENVALLLDFIAGPFPFLEIIARRRLLFAC